MAVVPIVSPMFTRYIKALCIEDALCDVIIGNLAEFAKQKNNILNNEKKSNNISKKIIPKIFRITKTYPSPSFKKDQRKKTSK